MAGTNNKEDTISSISKKANKFSNALIEKASDEIRARKMASS